ncbi:hypothetical protein KVV02_004298 [Mortierella alpina]|uniref:Pru domain-containing protein n=1 Tax=Mortierella alpina TaxID=64518 RepID=A0A9P7ZZR3_MORAP|nr:hypothetical protein KVV02_004298 [Mortierella alpina]
MLQRRRHAHSQARSRKRVTISRSSSRSLDERSVPVFYYCEAKRTVLSCVLRLVYMDEEDGLMHFYWKNRTTNTLDDDLILFPGDAELVRVPECTTGRVIMLKFKSSSQKLFFWLQEVNTDRDGIILQQANALINQGMEEAGQYEDEDAVME